jgi:hypothetical protein
MKMDDMVYMLGHLTVQLPPVLLLQGDPLPSTDILLHRLYGSHIAHCTGTTASLEC